VQVPIARGDTVAVLDQPLAQKGIMEGTKSDERVLNAAPAGEGEAQLLQEREWDTHASMQVKCGNCVQSIDEGLKLYAASWADGVAAYCLSILKQACTVKVTMQCQHVDSSQGRHGSVF